MSQYLQRGGVEVEGVESCLKKTGCCAGEGEVRQLQGQLGRTSPGSGAHPYLT